MGKNQVHHSMPISLSVNLSSNSEYKYGLLLFCGATSTSGAQPCYHLCIFVLLTSYSVNSNTQIEQGNLFSCVVLEIYFISRDLASLHILLF